HARHRLWSRRRYHYRDYRCLHRRLAAASAWHPSWQRIGRGNHQRHDRRDGPAVYPKSRSWPQRLGRLGLAQALLINSPTEGADKPVWAIVKTATWDCSRLLFGAAAASLVLLLVAVGGRPAAAQ